MILATLTDKFSHSTKDARYHLYQVMLIFKPDTVLAGIENWYVVSGPLDEKEIQADLRYRLNWKR
jgi:hypothetical protein